MSYCTLTDILGRMDEADVIAYTDDDDAGVVDTDKTSQAIAAADALIDAHLSSRYAVPMSPVPDMIKKLAVDVAVYEICSRRDRAPDGRRQVYEDALKLLEKLGRGIAVIPGATAAPESVRSGRAEITSSSRVFSRDSMTGF